MEGSEDVKDREEEDAKFMRGSCNAQAGLPASPLAFTRQRSGQASKTAAGRKRQANLARRA
jgi:hypothetical protein